MIKKKYTTIVQRLADTEDAFVPFPAELVEKYNLLSWNECHLELGDNREIIVHPMVRLSRFRRELNKWMRLIDRLKIHVAVYRKNKHIAWLVPYEEAKYLDR